MAFTDALFEGETELEGVMAKKVRTLDDLPFMTECHRAVPVAAQEAEAVTVVLEPDVIVDARMRKRSIAENRRGAAALVIGLGPNFCAGQNVDIAIETSWGDRLGEIIHAGPTMDLRGEPQAVGGHRRERFVYSPVAGTFFTVFAIGARVEAGEEIGTVDEVSIRAPLSGILRGLTHNSAMVETGTKLVEIDAQADGAGRRKIGDRPRRIAEGVLKAVQAVLGPPAQ
jgi:xanthine dehydrogenase accessory factor